MFGKSKPLLSSRGTEYQTRYSEQPVREPITPRATQTQPGTPRMRKSSQIATLRQSNPTYSVGWQDQSQKKRPQTAAQSKTRLNSARESTRENKVEPKIPFDRFNEEVQSVSSKAMSQTLSQKINKRSAHQASTQHLDKEKLSQLDKLSQTFKLVSIRDGETTVSLNSIRSHLRLGGVSGPPSSKPSSVFSSIKIPEPQVEVPK